MDHEHEEWLAALERTKEVHGSAGVWDPVDHPGCMLSGSLYLDRVPGRFYIQAQGNASGHDLDPKMTNLSHTIHHLSFESTEREDHTRGVALPHDFKHLIQPLDGKEYVTNELHQAYHHHIKLVSTNSRYYQMLHTNQLSIYDKDRIPETKFVLDISPIAVHYRNAYRPWYDYVTSILAIIGGAFTVFGMFESIFQSASERRRRYSMLKDQYRRKQAP